MGKTRKYEDHLMDRLKDPKEASAYLNACLEDEDVNVFLLAVRDVVKANKGFGGVAEEVGINRESLYKSLSKSGNPRLNSFVAVLKSIGLDIRVKPSRRR